MKNIKRIFLLLVLASTLGSTSFVNGMIARPYTKITYTFEKKASGFDKLFCPMFCGYKEEKEEKTFKKGDTLFNAAYTYFELIDNDMILDTDDRNELSDTEMEINLKCNYFRFRASINIIHNLLQATRLEPNNNKRFKCIDDVHNDLLSIQNLILNAFDGNVKKAFKVIKQKTKRDFSKIDGRLLYCGFGSLITGTVCCVFPYLYS